MCPALSMKFILVEFRKHHSISDFYSPFLFLMKFSPPHSKHLKKKKSKLEGKFKKSCFSRESLLYYCTTDPCRITIFHQKAAFFVFECISLSVYWPCVAP